MELIKIVAQASPAATPDPPVKLPETFEGWAVLTVTVAWIVREGWKAALSHWGEKQKQEYKKEESETSLMNSLITDLRTAQQSQLNQQQDFQKQWLTSVAGTQQELLIGIKDLQSKTRDDVHEMKDAVVGMSRTVQREIEASMKNSAAMYSQHSKDLQVVVGLLRSLHERLDVMMDERSGRADRAADEPS